jgi:hypothetical protein
VSDAAEQLRRVNVDNFVITLSWSRGDTRATRCCTALGRSARTRITVCSSLFLHVHRHHHPSTGRLVTHLCIGTRRRRKNSVLRGGAPIVL